MVTVAGVVGCTEQQSQQDQSDETDADRPESLSEPDDDGDTDTTEHVEAYDPLFDSHDLDEWESSGGELMVDRDEYVSGEHAARINVTSNDAWARIERTGLDLDLRNHRLNLVCQLHLPDTQGESIDIIAEDHDERQVRFRSRLHKTDDDTTFMPMDLGVREWDPDAVPDLSSVSRIRIQSRFGEDTSGTLWLDSLDAVSLPETPKLMIQWDDGFVSQYTEGLPIQDSYDIPSNTFINPTNVDAGENRLTLEQLEELQAAGWEISSHLLYHDNVTELDPAEQETQIREAKEWLIDHGFEQGAEYFAYPYGEHDQSSYDLVGEYHSLAMIGGEPGYGMPRNFPAIGRSSEWTFDEATAYVDLLIEWGGFGALFWHALPAETPVDEFDRIMSYIADRRDAGDLDVILLSELEEMVPVVPEVMPWHS